MKTQVKMLKVKIKSLAAEAHIIRLEERRAGRSKYPQPLRSSLREHRVGVVRSEQRLSLLAYAFLRGRPLYAVERKCKAAPDWTRVAKLVEKFGVAAWATADRKAQAAAFEVWRSVVAPA